MKKNFLKLILTLKALLVLFVVNAQGTLEWSQSGSNLTTIGANTSPVSVQFYRDLINPTTPGTFTVDPQPLIATVSYVNQQRSTTLQGSGTVVQGLLFGARNSPSTGGTAQAVGSTNIYNVFAADIPASKPTNNMYISSPSASPAAPTTASNGAGGSGLTGGFDTQSTTGMQGPLGDDANFGIAMFSSVEPLADINAPKDGEYYYGDIVINFNRAVKNPVIHLGGLGGSYNYQPLGAGARQITYFTTQLELVNAGASLTFMAGNPNLVVSGSKILNSNTRSNAGSIDNGATQEGFEVYGAASGSIRVNGNFTQLRFRVTVKGSALSDFGWSKTLADITSATRDPFNGDLWYLSMSLDKPTQQVSGNVFYDEDFTSGDIWRNVNNLQNYVGTDGSQNGSTLTSTAAGIFFVNLIDNNTNTVVASQPIGRDGSYLFDNVPTGAYRVQLTRDPAFVGTLSADGYPFNWRNTGQLIGLGTGNDGTISDASSTVFTLNSGDVQTQVNFGVFNLAALPSSITLAGSLSGTNASLSWNVLTDNNYTSYTLERSTNGINFAAINTAGSLNSTSAQLYRHNDNVATLGNKIYYRVKAIKRDGSSEYTNVVIFRLGGIKLTNIYPNPFMESVRIELESSVKENAQIRIIGLDGKVAAMSQEQVQVGGNQITINGLSKLAQGTYFIEVITSTQRIIEKINKSH